MNPFSSESRLTDTPSSCFFAIYKFIHIFNHLYCREKSEWVNETDVGSKARWELVLTVNHTSWLCLYTWTSAWLVWFDGHNNRPEGSEVTSERVVRGLIGTYLEPCLSASQLCSLCCVCRKLTRCPSEPLWVNEPLPHRNTVPFHRAAFLLNLHWDQLNTICPWTNEFVFCICSCSDWYDFRFNLTLS